MQKSIRLAILPAVFALSAPLWAADPPSGAAATPPAIQPAAPAPEAAKPDDSGDLQKQLADTQDKLAMSLHSYGLVHEESAELKDSLDKANAQLADAQAAIAALKAQAAAASQVDSLRTQLRQSQDEIAALSAENMKLKRRIALMAPAPGGAPSAPTRPAQP